ncbi:MAG: trigger factor [Rhodospirillaceae bacterium]|nr:trigger factor [Rhodospirillaceae bacterium]
MQVTEIQAEGLKRQFKVVVAAQDIQTKIDDRLVDLGRSIRVPGFRPGKVPMSLLRQRYGASVTGEVLERVVADGSRQAMSDRGLRPALQPKVEIQSFAAGTDLEFNMDVEVLPDINPKDFSQLKLEKLKVDLAEAEVDSGLERLAKSRARSEPLKEQRPIAKGDIAVIDFAGSIDGKEFAGGTAKGLSVNVGEGRLLPDMENGLVGLLAGSHADLTVNFPADYGAPTLAGKTAIFHVDVTEVRVPVAVAVDDGLAKEVGFDDLPALRKVMREQLDREYTNLARARLKRQLLDGLVGANEFDVPPGMVDMEFEAIWKNVEAERERGALDPADAGKSDDELRAEYRTIAARRVRLGLLLSEVGRLNNIRVSPEEVNRAMTEEARRFPGQERQVVEYYRKNPEALANLRAPLFEDKVVDFILELAKPTERVVGTEELKRLAASMADAASGPDKGSKKVEG